MKYYIQKKKIINIVYYMDNLFVLCLQFKLQTLYDVYKYTSHEKYFFNIYNKA